MILTNHIALPADHNPPDSDFLHSYMRGNRIGSEDDLVLMNMMSSGKPHLKSITEAREYRAKSEYCSESAFATDCRAAGMMGYWDGEVGRPIPQKASSTYLEAYERARREKLASSQVPPSETTASSTDCIPADESEQSTTFKSTHAVWYGFFLTALFLIEIYSFLKWGAIPLMEWAAWLSLFGAFIMYGFALHKAKVATDAFQNGRTYSFSSSLRFAWVGFALHIGHLIWILMNVDLPMVS